MGYQQKSYKKFVATAATATLVASAIVPVASAAGFSDVSADSEFAPFINALVEEGIINGYASDNTFRPNNKLTRGQVAIMLGRWLENNGATVPADWATNPRFSDVSSSNEELSKYAALVKDTGVFTGVQGKLNPTQNITRENMAVVLDRVATEVAGVSLVELAEEIEDVEVKDLATAQTAYQDEIQALADLGITTVSNFRPKEQVSRAQFAKFLYTTFEIIEEVTAAPTADELKAEVASIVGTLPALNTITADSAATAKTAATEATTALAEVEKVIAEGNYTEAEVTELNKVIADAKASIEAVVAAADKAIEDAKVLAVESVSALNAKEVQIKFNQKVKKSTVTATDISVTAVGGTTALTLDTTVGTGGFELSQDGKTVTVHLASALTNATGYDVKVDTGVLNEKGEGLEKASVSTFQFNDTVKPTVTSVQSVNGDVVVNFSEKLAATATTVVINGQSHTVTPTAGDTKVTVAKSNFTGTKALEAGKNYSVVVAGAEDYVGNAMDLYSGTVTYSVITDTVAPTVSSVKTEGEKTFTVTFSEKIKLAGTTPVASDLGLVLTTPTGTTFTPSITTKDNQTFTVDLGASPFTGLATTQNVIATFTGYKDEALNVGATSSQTLTFTKDTTAPKLVNAEFNANTKKFAFNFDETLLAGAQVSAASVTIVDNATGKTVATAVDSAAIEANSKTVVFDNSAAGLNLPAGSYTFYFAAGAVTDAAGAANTSAAFTTKVTVTGSVAVKPAVTSVSADATNTITVTYDAAKTAVKGGNVAGSATDAANYKLNGQALPAGSVLTIDPTNQVVTIKVPAGAIDTTAVQILTISGVQALNSNATIETINTTVSLTDTKAPEITTASVNANGDLVLTFSESINGTTTGTGTQPVIGDFIVAVDGTQVASGLTVANGAADNQLIIKSADVSFATGTITVKATGTTTGKDAAGNSISTVNTVTATR